MNLIDVLTIVLEPKHYAKLLKLRKTELFQYERAVWLIRTIPTKDSIYFEVLKNNNIVLVLDSGETDTILNIQEKMDIEILQALLENTR